MNNQLSIKSPYLKPQQNHLSDELVSVVWSYVENYWTLKRETPEYFLLTRTKVTVKGHLIIAVLFGWWLLFIPNLLYHIVMKERKKIYK